ncbi:MAG: four helix bundle protein [Bacteroidales bacterium]
MAILGRFRGRFCDHFFQRLGFIVSIINKTIAMIHKKMDVWKLSIEMVIDVYQLTRSYPVTEKFGLTNQMRRAAVSVPSNIAEGTARNSKKECAHFLRIALGSLTELETQLIISQRLGFCASEANEILEKEKRIAQMLLGLLKHFNP